MPFAGTRQLPDEPIIITTYEGAINVDEVTAGSMEVAKLMGTIEGRVWAVVDLSTITTSFADVMKIMMHQSQGTEGTTTDPKLAAMVLVGSDQFVRLYTDAMRKKTQGVILPMYRTIDDGVNALRIMIENEKKKQATEADKDTA